MKKIMFTDDLTAAVLEGRKTMTRRLVSERLLEEYSDYDDYVKSVAPADIPCSRAFEKEFFSSRSYYKPDEVIAVAQRYSELDHRTFPVFVFEAGAYRKTRETHGWNNKQAVQACLMPHQIRITNVRVERLQDISEEDCLKEGVITNGVLFYVKGEGIDPYPDGRSAFSSLIDETCGRGTWDSNPWVFVYDFELVK